MSEESSFPRILIANHYNISSFACIGVWGTPTIDGYQTSDIIYKWVSEGTPRVGVAITLPSFDLISITDYESEFGLTTGNFSRIGVKFIIERQVTAYFFRIYFPLIIIVILSFAPFYLSFKLAFSRLIISISTFITFTLISILISVNFCPKTGEFTTLDVYLWIGFLFTAASLVLTIAGIKWNYDHNTHAPRSYQAYDNRCQPNKSDSANGARSGRKSESCESAIEMNERGIVSSSAIPMGSLADENVHIISISSKSGISDQIGAMILPLLFLFFNLIYWITSLLFPSALLA